jgi:hypothetical protein
MLNGRSTAVPTTLKRDNRTHPPLPIVSLKSRLAAECERAAKSNAWHTSTPLRLSQWRLLLLLPLLLIIVRADCVARAACGPKVVVGAR